MDFPVRVLIVHRDYRLKGGEDFFLETTLLPALHRNGIPHTVLRLPALFSTSSVVSDFFEMLFLIFGLEKWRPSYLRLRVQSHGHTHVLFNNFLPTISLAAPEMCKARGLKTLWWAHNARLSCANGLLFNGREVCHRCLTHGSRWAWKQKCYSSRLQSVLYAWIYRLQRVVKRVGPHLDQIVGVSEYTLKNLNEAFRVGLNRSAPTQVIYMPTTKLNLGPKSGVNPEGANFEKLFGDSQTRPYVFLGRVSFEKGADLFVELARKITHRNFILAGTGPMLEELKQSAPKNLVFAGLISRENEKAWLFENAEALIIPSRVPENSPLVIFESDVHGTPIVYPSGGGAEEVVKYLNRSGCPLQDFHGQSFARSVPSGHLERFDLQLVHLFRT